MALSLALLGRQPIASGQSGHLGVRVRLRAGTVATSAREISPSWLLIMASHAPVTTRTTKTAGSPHVAHHQLIARSVFGHNGANALRLALAIKSGRAILTNLLLAMAESHAKECCAKYALVLSVAIQNVKDKPQTLIVISQVGHSGLLARDLVAAASAFLAAILYSRRKVLESHATTACKSQRRATPILVLDHWSLTVSGQIGAHILPAPLHVEVDKCIDIAQFSRKPRMVDGHAQRETQFGYTLAAPSSVIYKNPALGRLGQTGKRVLHLAVLAKRKGGAISFQTLDRPTISSTCLTLMKSTRTKLDTPLLSNTTSHFSDWPSLVRFLW